MPGAGAWYLVEGPIGAPHLHHQLLHVVPRRLGAGCPGPAPPLSLSRGGDETVTTRRRAGKRGEGRPLRM
uniref:Uncharacterized protein n=1 Tax=Chelonoidis abingdonii TaxID=106734 RepID=A0A8C0G4W2_CHEAB